MNAKNLHTRLSEVEQWYGLQRYEHAANILLEVAAEIQEDYKRAGEIAAKIDVNRTKNRGYRK